MVPKVKKDEIVHEGEMYYKNLANGTANYEDYEWYIYGPSANMKSKDDTDIANDKAKKIWD